MGKIRSIKLKAGTLVETIIAMLIILVITAITITIFVQATNTGYSIQNLKATSLINQYSSEAESGKIFFDEEVTDGAFRIRKEIIENNYGKNIVWMKVSVYDQNNKLIKSRNCLLSSK